MSVVEPKPIVQILTTGRHFDQEGSTVLMTVAGRGSASQK